MEKSNLINTIGTYGIENKCCGCTACFNICPAKAIDMVPNQKGFYIPNINLSKCISCNLCSNVCQINNTPLGHAPSEKYAVVNYDTDVRMKSSSGGLFWLLLTSMFEHYGKNFHCFGVKLDNNLTAVYTRADSLEECTDFRGSKYVQSDLGNTFTQISELLIQGHAVMFVGAGCQCAGLKNYIKTKNIPDDQLFIVDIICHGMPSNKMWKSYISEIEKRAGCKLVTYQFRNKHAGWRGQHPYAVFENGVVAENDKLFLSYGKLFGNLSLNTTCYSCKYANIERIGDITMGDYWGIEKSTCTFDDGHGVSVCLINTQKGQNLFSSVQAKAKTYRIEDDSYLQPQLCSPTKKNILCEKFWRDYNAKGYLYVANKYAGHSKIYRLAMKALATMEYALKRKKHE